MAVINKSRLVLPGYMDDTFNEICKKVNLLPSDVDLIIKRRNRCVGDCWIKKGNRHIPSGHYSGDLKTIIVRIGRRTHPDDFSFVLAHEIGHLLDHREHREEAENGYPLSEKKATDFALACNCYPHSKYKGVKGKKEA
jgi:Zn-dependent peptidase ImmA (M78 family)